ncbi:hypothetical protein NLY38_02945 [Ectopseudomonas hydrolytica]|nr:hypothetical protein [Pseudomonas hydrolytica]MBF8159949.1 hypothetical protein [Pseudomonas mendocina]UTH32285.1 hypothetical protein NLY38_02945 [Pseudomonas hydrolytica]UZZ11475.1 hypothetical protein NDO41_03065 [Pseudomonas mendocina]
MNKRPQLVYLAFGADIYQFEAIFSIASSLARSVRRDWDIQVFTDAPALYAGLPVATHSISPQWKGPHDYHFRIKHAALQEVLREHEIAALVDTDTFFHESPQKLFERILPGHLLCNSIGSKLVDAGHSATFLAALESNGLLDSTMRQTNSGVIGLHAADSIVLERSIALMDEHYSAAMGVYTFEEICLALAAHNRLALRECPDLLHHYWSRKAHFRAKVLAWHDKHRDTPTSELALRDLHDVSVQLPRPPQPLRTLQKIATLAVPPEQRQFTRESLYGCYRYSNEFDRACSRVWWEKALENAERRMGDRLNMHTLNLWLNHPVLRTLAGSFHQDLTRHLGALRAEGDNP